jgi:hypothetical protein
MFLSPSIVTNPHLFLKYRDFLNDVVDLLLILEMTELGQCYTKFIGLR